MTHDELAHYVAPIIAKQYPPEQIAELACRLMDVRALDEWAAQLVTDAKASPPASAFGVAKRN